MNTQQHQDHVPTGQEGSAVQLLAFTDNRPEAMQLNEAEGMVQNSPRTIAQRHVFQEAFGEPNETGMPDDLKTGVESLSGIDLSDVRVHYNSPMPARFRALAYAQGNAIHLGPGEERHLPHEAWHIVQQKQNRVKPTLQLMGRQANDDSTLEREAMVMGLRASHMPQHAAIPLKGSMAPASLSSPMQCVKEEDLTPADWKLVNSIGFQLFVRQKQVKMNAGYGNWLATAAKKTVEGYIAEYRAESSGVAARNENPKPAPVKASVPKGGAKRGAKGSVPRLIPGAASVGAVKKVDPKESKKEEVVHKPANLFQDLLDADGDPRPDFLEQLIAAYKADLITSRAYLTEGEGDIVARDMGIIIKVYQGQLPEDFGRVENDGGGDCLIHALVQANKFRTNAAYFQDGASKDEILAYRRKISERIDRSVVESLCIAEIQGRINGGQNSLFGPSFTPLIKQFPTNLKSRLPKSESKKEEVEKVEQPQKEKGSSSGGNEGGNGAARPCLGGDVAQDDTVALFHTGGNHWVFIVKKDKLKELPIGLPKAEAKEESKTDIKLGLRDGNYIDAVISFIDRRVKQTRDERVKRLLENIKKRWQRYKNEKVPKLPYYYAAFFSGVNLGEALSKVKSQQWIATKPLMDGVKDIPKSYGPVGVALTEETEIEERGNETREYKTLVYRCLELKQENIALVIAESLPDGNEPAAKKAGPPKSKGLVKAKPVAVSTNPKKVSDLRGKQTDQKNNIAKFETDTKNKLLAQDLPSDIPVVTREEAELEWALMAEARRVVDPATAMERHEFEPSMRPIRKEDLKEDDIFCVTDEADDNIRQVYYGIYRDGKYMRLNNAGDAFIESSFAKEEKRIFYFVTHGKGATPSNFYDLTAASESLAQQAESLIADLAAISVMIKSPNKPEGEQLTLHQLYALASDGLTIGNHTRRVLHVYGKIGPEIAEGFLTRKEFMLLIALHDIGKGYGQSKAKDKTSGKQHDYTDQVFESIEKNEGSLAETGVSKEKLSLMRHTINMDPIGELLRASQSGVVPQNSVVKATKEIVTAYRAIAKSNPGITLQVYFEYVLMPFYISDSASYSSHGNYSKSRGNPNPLNWSRTLYPPGKFDLSTIYNHPAIKALREQLAKEGEWSLTK